MGGQHTARQILRVDGGADHPGSVSRRLADDLLVRISGPDDQVVRRELSAGVPFVDGAWVAAAFAGIEPSSLATSDELVDELLAADVLVLVSPMYNFGVPAALKAWIDQVARAGRTFEFSEAGPVGKVKLDSAWIVTATGGTPVGSPLDFNTTYLRALLEFLGVHDVRVVGAEQLALRGEAAYQDALVALEAAVA